MRRGGGGGPENWEGEKGGEQEIRDTGWKGKTNNISMSEYLTCG